jgi:hypothetical protein
MDKSKDGAISAARSIYRSGAINKDDPDYEDSYVLPKLFIVAYADHMAWDWSPVNSSKKYRNEIKNISRFI